MGTRVGTIRNPRGPRGRGELLTPSATFALFLLRFFHFFWGFQRFSFVFAPPGITFCALSFEVFAFHLRLSEALVCFRASGDNLLRSIARAIVNKCWDCFEIILGSCWDHAGIILESFWDQFGIILGSFWNHFESIFWSFLDHFGIILGSFWNHFGSILESLWDRVGIVLG